MASLVAFSLAILKKVPSLIWLAAQELIAKETSGYASIPNTVSIISCTFLLGSHYFSPSISWQISPSLMFGWQMGVLNFSLGNLKGNCSGKSMSTMNLKPSQGLLRGPLMRSSQWKRFSLMVGTTPLYRVKRTDLSFCLVRCCTPSAISACLLIV